MEINFSGVIRRAALAAAAVLAVTAGPAAADPLTPTDDVDRRVAEPGGRQHHRHVLDRGHRRSARRRRAAPSGLTGTVSLDVASAPIAGCRRCRWSTAPRPARARPGAASRLPPRRRRLLRRHGRTRSPTASTTCEVIAPATVTPSVTPNPVLRLAPITYKADGRRHQPTAAPSSPPSPTSARWPTSSTASRSRAAPRSRSTTTFKSSCPSLAPPVGGTHVLKTVYSGSHYAGPNFATTNFVVLAPVATLPETVDFASVTVGDVRHAHGHADQQRQRLPCTSAAPRSRARARSAVTADGCVGEDPRRRRDLRRHRRLPPGRRRHLQRHARLQP